KSRQLVLILWTLALTFAAVALLSWWWARNSEDPRPGGSSLVYENLRGGFVMTTIKVLELVGESPNSWDEAVANAVADASKTIEQISGVEVCNLSANVAGGRGTE